MRKLFLLACVTVIAAASGCGKKTDAKTELEKAADVLATTEGQPAQPANAPVESPPVSPAAPSETPSAPITTPAQEMRQALVAYKAGQLEDAVTRLQKLRAARTLTPQQRMALQDSVAAVMAEVYDLAAKGNPRAIQAVAQYEEMQSRPR